MAHSPPPTKTPADPSGPDDGFEAQVWGQGMPLLLLHGLLPDPESYGGLADELASMGFRVVAPDWGVSGRALWRARGLLGLTDALLGFADEEIGDRFAVVGDGLGATLAFAMAGRQPRRITRLVAINGGHPAQLLAGSSSMKTLVEQGTLRALGRLRDAGSGSSRSGILSRVGRMACEGALRDHLRRESDGLMEAAEVERLLRRATSAPFARTVRELATPRRARLKELVETLARTPAPALMLVGDRDDRLARLVPPRRAHRDVALQRALRAGMYVHRGRPQWVARQCADFLLSELFVQPPIHA